MNPLMMAFRTAATRMRDTGKKKVESQAEEEATDNSELTVEMLPSGDGVVSVKQQIPAHVLSASAKEKGEEIDLRKSISQLSGLFGTPDPFEEVDLSTPQSRRKLANELGANPLTSRIDSWRIARGLVSKDSAQRQIREKRLAELGQRYKEIQPFINDIQQDRTAKRIEESAVATAGRTRRNSVMRTINQLEDDALTPENVAAFAEVDSLDDAEMSALKAEQTKRFKKRETEEAKAAVAAINEARKAEDQRFQREQNERANRTVERVETEATKREERRLKKETDDKVKDLGSKIDANNREIRRNAARAATLDPDEDAGEIAELRRQRQELIGHNEDLVASMRTLGYNVAAPKKEAPAKKRGVSATAAPRVIPKDEALKRF